MLIVGLVLPSTPLLAFIGLALLTTTGSSATSHSQHSWITPWTIRPTIWLDPMPGFPSYCTGSLLEIPPSNTKTGLTEYRASRYFARLPTCLAESGSLSLCTSNFLWLPSDPAVGQQRPCHSDYLPLSQGDSGFFQPDGFASFAGQTKKSSLTLLFAFLKIVWACG